MKPFNRGQWAEGIASLLGLKGMIPLGLEESALSVLSFGEVEASPYGAVSVPWFVGTTVAAVAAELGQVHIRAPLLSDNILVQVDAIDISNPAAASRTFSIVQSNAASRATSGLAAVQAFNRRLKSGLTIGTSNENRVPAFFDFGTHTVQSHTNIGQICVAAGDSRTLVLPGPGWILRGDNAEKVGLGIVAQTVNEILICNFWGRVWPLEG